MPHSAFQLKRFFCENSMTKTLDSPLHLLWQKQVLPYYHMQTITFKVPEEEADFIRQEARKNDLSISEFIRRKIRNDTGTAEPVKEVFCPITHTTIFSGSSDLPPLTTESVKKILADFP